MTTGATGDAAATETVAGAGSSASAGGITGAAANTATEVDGTTNGADPAAAATTTP